MTRSLSITGSLSRRTLAAGAISALMLLVVPGVSQARSQDRDRDGLTAKQEKRYKTNPRKADTDSDGLKDGAEVKRYRTNPRKSDTDADGIRDDRELRAKSNPRKKDSDGDGLDDLYEHGRYGEAEEIEGVITELDGSSITITSEDETTTDATLDSLTRLRAPDVNGDGEVTIDDFEVGDQVEAHVEATDSGDRVLSLKLEGDDDQGDLQDGQGPDDSDDDSDQGDDPEDSPDEGDDPAEQVEVKGRIVEVGADSVTVVRRDNSRVELAIDGDTRLRAPDRDRSGTITLDDFRTGDRVEAKASSDLATTFELTVD